MRYRYILILLVLILGSVNLAYSQSKKNTELNSLKEQVKVLEDKNSQLETKISIADNKIELLTKQIQLLEEQNELLKNNINLLNNNLSNSTPKDDGIRYTIKFSTELNSMIKKIKDFVRALHVSYFEYNDVKNIQDENGRCYSSYGSASVCLDYEGEIGIFNSLDEALKFKSTLPKGVTYEIIQINPK